MADTIKDLAREYLGSLGADETSRALHGGRGSTERGGHGGAEKTTEPNIQGVAARWLSGEFRKEAEAQRVEVRDMIGSLTEPAQNVFKFQFARANRQAEPHTDFLENDLMVALATLLPPMLEKHEEPEIDLSWFRSVKNPELARQYLADIGKVREQRKEAAKHRKEERDAEVKKAKERFEDLGKCVRPADFDAEIEKLIHNPVSQDLRKADEWLTRHTATGSAADRLLTATKGLPRPMDAMGRSAAKFGGACSNLGSKLLYVGRLFGRRRP